MKIKSPYLSAIILFLFLKINEAYAQVTFNFRPAIAKTDVTEIITETLKWILGVAGSIALLALIFEGLMYMTSAGSQQKASKAKTAIKWTLAGLILVLLSYSILVVIDRIFT